MTGRYQKGIDVKAHCAFTVILLAGILDTPWSRERYAKLFTSTVLFRTTGYILLLKDGKTKTMTLTSDLKLS